nr:MAG TPA: hypothetical protein [Caudoviricetes sp.]
MSRALMLETILLMSTKHEKYNNLTEKRETGYKKYPS